MVSKVLEKRRGNFTIIEICHPFRLVYSKEKGGQYVLEVFHFVVFALRGRADLLLSLRMERKVMISRCQGLCCWLINSYIRTETRDIPLV